MLKPKCHQCHFSMKFPYHRQGAAGNWEKINRWWYCSRCNNMSKQLYQISKETEEYLETAAALKFPVIARRREEFNSSYVDIGELEIAIADPIRNVNTRKIMYKSKKKISNFQPRWFCESCRNYELLNSITILNDISDDEITEIQPLHCNNKMKLTIVNAAGILYDNQYERRANIINNSNELDNLKFIEYMLIEFSLFGFEKMKGVFVKFVSEDENFPTNSYGYEMMELFIELFLGNQDELYDAKGLNYLAISKYNPTNVTLQRIREWGQDLIDYVRLKSVVRIPQIRRILWTIETLTENWIKRLD